MQSIARACVRDMPWSRSAANDQTDEANSVPASPAHSRHIHSALASPAHSKHTPTSIFMAP